MSPKFVERKDSCSVKDIDKSIKHKWNWSWMEKSADDVLLDVFIRKLHKAGTSYSLWCECQINYSASGAKAYSST